MNNGIGINLNPLDVLELFKLNDEKYLHINQNIVEEDD